MDRRLTVITLAWLLLAGVAAAQNPASPNPDLPARVSDAAHLRGGWYPWDPYQYRDYRRGVPILTGFDVEIERALARIMSVEIVLPEIAWENHLAALAAGTADIAAGATPSEARSLYAYFSKPYRTETDVLILPRGASGRYPFHTIEQMLDTFGKQKFRLGVVAGFVYADDRVNAFIADEAHRDQIVAVPSDVQNLRNLLAGVIDGFLADRITAATTAWRRHEGARIEEHRLRFSTNIHFMLSRATQTPQMLARLNDAIDELRRSGELRRIADAYAMPVLINQTLDSEWFRVLAFIGIVAFALSGVVLAYEGQYTLFGALVLAALPAVGGGIVRDLLLQREPLGIVQNPEALLTVFGTVLAGMVVIKTVPRIRAGLSPTSSISAASITSGGANTSRSPTTRMSSPCRFAAASTRAPTPSVASKGMRLSPSRINSMPRIRPTPCTSPTSGCALSRPSAACSTAPRRLARPTMSISA